MKEQVISFETAKLAKEKGFVWKCEMCFLSEENEPQPFKNPAPSMSNKIEMVYSAPTQSLLQRWVWETHSIWVQSTPIFTANECIGVSVTISSWRFPVINVNYVGFDVYDGLENGLFEALKLI